MTILQQVLQVPSRLSATVTSPRSCRFGSFGPVALIVLVMLLVCGRASSLPGPLSRLCDGVAFSLRLLPRCLQQWCSDARRGDCRLSRCSNSYLDGLVSHCIMHFCNSVSAAPFQQLVQQRLWLSRPVLFLLSLSTSSSESVSLDVARVPSCGNGSSGAPLTTSKLYDGKETEKVLTDSSPPNQTYAVRFCPMLRQISV